MDRLTPEQRHKNMAAIKNKDTKPELVLRKALWKSNIRYRKNFDKLPGKPDIAITKYKIAIFVDGELFHGKDWDILRFKLATGQNGEKWITKIQRNMQRDDENTKQLRFLGWTVLRFWGKDIIKNPDYIVSVIQETIFNTILSERNEEITNDL